MTSNTSISRRQFLINSSVVAGGLAIGFDLTGDGSFAVAGTPGNPSAPLSTPELGAWVVVKPNDDVIVRIVKSEMGQGTITGLAQLVAEEWECDWSKVS